MNGIAAKQDMVFASAAPARDARSSASSSTPTAAPALAGSLSTSSAATVVSEPLLVILAKGKAGLVVEDDLFRFLVDLDPDLEAIACVSL